MWIDRRGVCHTVALPDPTLLMSDVFRSSLDRLLAEAPEAVAETVEIEEDRFFEEHLSATNGVPDDEGYVEAIPPERLMADAVATVGDLQLVIQGIDRRWRLDAVTALDDYIS